jgi:hypothetical protein
MRHRLPDYIVWRTGRDRLEPEYTVEQGDQPVAGCQRIVLVHVMCVAVFCLCPIERQRPRLLFGNIRFAFMLAFTNHCTVGLGSYACIIFGGDVRRPSGTMTVAALPRGGGDFASSRAAVKAVNLADKGFPMVCLEP